PLSWTEVRNARNETINAVLRPILGTNTTGSGMGAAARQYFGSWDSALIASNLDPLRIRQGKHWNKELIIRCLQALEAAGVPLNCNSLVRDNIAKAGAVLRE